MNEFLICSFAIVYNMILCLNKQANTFSNETVRRGLLQQFLTNLSCSQITSDRDKTILEKKIIFPQILAALHIEHQSGRLQTSCFTTDTCNLFADTVHKLCLTEVTGWQWQLTLFPARWQSFELTLIPLCDYVCVVYIDTLCHHVTFHFNNVIYNILYMYVLITVMLD